MGLFGAVLTNEPQIVRIRPLIAIGLGIAVAIAACFWLLPHIVGERWRNKRVHSLFEGWSLSKTLQLIPMRVIYFGILVVYAALALKVCGLDVDHHVVASSIPLVLLADGLPSFAGFGTRDASLQLLLAPKDRAVLLAMSLIWTMGIIVVRSVIGLAHLWGQQIVSGMRGSMHSDNSATVDLEAASANTRGLSSQ
jgi:hypothetical protein